MNAQERLQHGRTAAIEGRYDEALADYEWFHHNAVAEDSALRGVRRSFALSYWAELGSHYPPAQTALVALRDAKLRVLQSGTLDVGLFADLVSINRYLEDEASTYREFLRLHETDTTFARTCFAVAFPAIVGAGAYQLARDYISDPRAAVTALLEDFNESTSRAAAVADKRRRKSRLDAYTSNFAADIQLILETVRHTDGTESSNELYRAAIEGVCTDAMRKRVCRKLDA